MKERDILKRYQLERQVRRLEMMDIGNNLGNDRIFRYVKKESSEDFIVRKNELTERGMKVESNQRRVKEKNR